MLNKILAFGKTLISNKKSQTETEIILDNQQEITSPEVVVNEYDSNTFVNIIKKEIYNAGKKVNITIFREHTDSPLYKISFVYNFTTINLCEVDSDFVNMFQEKNYPLNSDTVKVVLQKYKADQQMVDEFKAQKKSKAAIKFEYINQQRSKVV